MVKIAVIMFPGTNCEEETKRACEEVGMAAEIVRWNSNVDLSKFDGYILPGGWSYEDRIRAGAIAAKDKIMVKIKEEVAKGKVVLGICNGAQVLIETGIIPGLKGKVEMALAPNINPKIKGYYCTWTNVLVNNSLKTAFNYDVDNVTALTIAHGEGRFVSRDDNLIDELEKNGQLLFKYCDEDGNVSSEFPINPNGSTNNIAAICNKEGNVMAMMPHPERSVWKKQLIGMGIKYEGNLGPGAKIFLSMKKWIEVKNG
jgi:phosphoribosylformylglycinamidine synthase subunit PurQ / glutaminase